MNIEYKNESKSSEYIRISVKENDLEIGRGFLFIIINELHSEPYGYIEDVHVDENYQGRGIGKQIMHQIVEIAKDKGCYKLVLTSRNKPGREKIHDFYKNVGFELHGNCYRMNLLDIKSAY